jgi:methionine aminopeptidase
MVGMHSLFMSDLHSVSAVVDSKESFEAVHPQFIREKLLEAQEKTWKVLHQIRASLKAGMTEDEARHVALKIFLEWGVSKHWHKPYIRFGPGTILTFHDPLQADYRLQVGDPVYIDLGPVWTDSTHGLSYEGDVGDTFVLGSNPDAEHCAATARRLFEEAQQEWREKKLSGEELYRFLKSRASALGYHLVEEVDGHRLGDFPHHKYSKERLKKIQFIPGNAVWVLEIQINHPTLRIGAFFENILVE